MEKIYNIVFKRKKLILYLTCLSGQFPGHVVSYFYINVNEKRRREQKRGDLRFLAGCTQEGGGGHLDIYCVQQGG